MTATPSDRNPSNPSRPASRVLIGLVLLVILLAIGWSAVWVYAANRAEREIDAWVAREARLGRIWNCGERNLAGFPFRFELRCRAPSLETRGGDPVRISAVSAQAVAQIWAPNHIVAEFTPPARVEELATGRVYGGTWSLLQLSGVGDLSGRPQRFSVQAHDPKVQDAAALTPGAEARPLLSAKLFEFHVRRTAAAAASAGALDGLDYASGMTGGESALLAALGIAGPVDMSLQGNISAAADLRPMPVAQRLRAWAAAGGVARLDRFVMTTPEIAINADGTGSLTQQGRLNGNLTLGFSGLNELTQRLDRAGVIPSELAPIIGALALVGKPTTVDGRKGVSFALGFRDGTLRLGPVPVGVIPPLF